MPYEELLNACFSFEICHPKLKLWAVKERASKWYKISLEHGLYIAFGTSKLSSFRSRTFEESNQPICPLYPGAVICLDCTMLTVCVYRSS